MDPKYSEMSLIELKHAAKGRRIKQYYIMKRVQLIELLSLAELPQSLKIEKMTIHELRDEARRRGMRGYWNLRREDLVRLLFPEQPGNVHETAPHENKKNEGHADKHDDPQQHDAENVGIQHAEDAGNNRFDDVDLNT